MGTCSTYHNFQLQVLTGKRRLGTALAQCCRNGEGEAGETGAVARTDGWMLGQNESPHLLAVFLKSHCEATYSILYTTVNFGDARLLRHGLLFQHRQALDCYFHANGGFRRIARPVLEATVGKPPLIRLWPAAPAVRISVPTKAQRIMVCHVVLMIPCSSRHRQDNKSMFCAHG